MRRLTASLSSIIMAVLAFHLTTAGTPAIAQASRAPEKKLPPNPPLPEGAKVETNLEYGPHERNKLDLYLPKGEGPFPLVIWVHGGAWLAGSKDGGNPALRLLEKGFAVAAINYRLSGQAIFPAQLNDCKAAVRFLRADAKKYNLDPDHFGAFGGSAGGHLVALVGTSGAAKEPGAVGIHPQVSARVQAVCDWYGPIDLTKMGEHTTIKGPIDHDSPNSPESKLIGGPILENKDKAKHANPIEYISKDCPPFLILHGDKDPIVPVKQSEIFHDALQKAGIDSTLIVVAGGEHGKGIGTPEHSQKIEEFFTKHLKVKR